MRRSGILIATTLALVFAAVAPTDAAKSPLAGTWKGTMRPTGDGYSSKPYAYTITISANGRSGTWKAPPCKGKLTYLRRENGRALFRQSLTSGPCVKGSIDRIKRQGSGLHDSIKSPYGKEYNSAGTLRRP